jgi:hypothetical protein
MAPMRHKLTQNLKCSPRLWAKSLGCGLAKIPFRVNAEEEAGVLAHFLSFYS